MAQRNALTRLNVAERQHFLVATIAAAIAANSKRNFISLRLFSFSLSLNTKYTNNIFFSPCMCHRENEMTYKAFMCVTYQPLHKIHNFITHKINFVRI